MRIASQLPSQGLLFAPEQAHSLFCHLPRTKDHSRTTNKSNNEASIVTAKNENRCNSSLTPKLCSSLKGCSSPESNSRNCKLARLILPKLKLDLCWQCCSLSTYFSPSEKLGGNWTQQPTRKEPACAEDSPRLLNSHSFRHKVVLPSMPRYFQVRLFWSFSYQSASSVALYCQKWISKSTLSEGPNTVHGFGF